jgi:hypothetical protein
VADRLPAELAARVRLLAAEALARLRRGPEARPYLDRVPASLLADIPLLHLRALRIRLWLGEVRNLAGELDRCDRALEQSGDAANRALLGCEEGRAWDREGDLSRAQECWLRAERLTSPARRGPDPIRADVLLQLGRLDHLRGHLGPALQRYGAALACACPGPQVLEVRLRSLLVRLDFNQKDQVHAAAEEMLGGRVLEALPEELRPLAGMVRGLLDGAPPADASDEQRAYHAAAAGDGAAARALYHRALADTPSPERRARLALALGMLGQGEPSEARAWLRQAEDLARSLDLPEVLARALQVRGQQAEQAGDEPLARQLFEEVALVTEVQARQLPPLDGIPYREQRGSVLRHLLRSACRRGDAARVFHYQELERGRLLLDLLHTEAPRAGRIPLALRPDLADLERQIAACEEELAQLPADRRRDLLRQAEKLRLERDRCFEEYLRDRRRPGSAVLPTVPDLEGLRRVLPPGVLYAAPSLLEDELYLLVASRAGPAEVLRGPGSGKALRETLAALRGCLGSQIARYRHGLPLGLHERGELDRLLEELGRGPLGAALGQALAAARPRRLVWVPEGPLHGLPVPALRREGRYLIEDHEVVSTFSGALLVHQARARRRRGPWRPAVVVTEAPEVLPEAAREGAGVAAAFLRSRVLHGGPATREALRPWLARARVAHFACHAQFDSEHPLAAVLALPSGETLGALAWLDEPVMGLPLVTLSACRSAEVAPLRGREVFGLVTGLLGAGVRAVLAGLWTVADREAVSLMWHFYRQRMTNDLGAALALAQREALAAPASSPLFWAAFALFGDAEALPAPGPAWRWLARWRQRHHAHRFGVSNA